MEGETRTNTKIYEKNGRVTELNEKGPSISSRKIENLLCKLDTYAGADTLFVLAGSVPGTVETEIYARIIERVLAKGAKDPFRCRRSFVPQRTKGEAGYDQAK